MSKIIPFFQIFFQKPDAIFAISFERSMKTNFDCLNLVTPPMMKQYMCSRNDLANNER